MSTCTLFANYTSSLSRYLATLEADADASHPPPPDSTEVPDISTAPDLSNAAKLNKLFDNLDKYEVNFSRHLKILLDALNYLAATETVVFLSLCARLSMAGEGTGATLGASAGADGR